MTTVSAPAQRIHIIGPSCAGKTTLGRALGERLGLPFTDLDDLWWSPGWVQCGHPALRERVADLAATPAWVVSGNYFASTEVALWPRLQWLIVLDFPLGLVTRRALSRTWRRAVTGEACCNGNQEKWYRLFHRDGVIRYTWRTWATRQARHRQLSHDPALAGVTITRLGSPADVERLWRDLSVAVPRNATPRHATPAA